VWKIFYYLLWNKWLADVLYAQLEMEDGDEIDAMLHQTGGGMTLWCLVSFGRHHGNCEHFLYMLYCIAMSSGSFCVRNFGKSHF
jgi:hypothetical protein